MSRNNEFIIYAASAGSGKTFTLVNEYLALMLGHSGSFRQILAITFTNKATAEMKTRIISELHLLASGKNSAHLSSLLSKTGISEDQLRSTAGICLKNILHDYSSFAVSTIDSFFQQMAATLSRELKLPLRFDIELNAKRVRADVAARVLEQAGKDISLTNWLLDLLFARLEEGKGWKLRNDLGRMTNEVMFNVHAQELALSGGRETIAELIITLRAIRKKVEDRMRGFGLAALQATEEHGFVTGDFKYATNGGPNSYLERIAYGKPEWKLYGDIKLRILQGIEDPSTFGKKEIWNDSTFRELVTRHLHPLLVESTTFFKEHESEYTGAAACLKLIYHAGITTAIDEQLKNFRSEKELFLLSDTTRMLRQSIGDEDAPFIYEKSGIAFRHVFIDEFQDTSNEQWEILRPLVRNSLGSGNKVLLVGDAKQSIYRWRGGNMHLILSDAEKDMAGFKSITRKESLGKNWRSAAVIVDFNNAFFPNAANQLILAEPEYTDAETLREAYSTASVEQESRQDLAGKGYVEIAFCEKSSDENWKEQCLLRLSATLDSLKAEGISSKDIAILFRKNLEEQLLADHLLAEAKHPFISSNSLLLHKNPVVAFLINCFRLASGKNESLLIIEIEEFVLEKGLAGRYGEGLIYGSQGVSQGESWTEKNILPLLNRLKNLPLVLAAASLAEMAGCTESDPYLDAFIDVITDYAAYNAAGMCEFVSWWDEQLETTSFSVDIPESTNAIRLLSIHRAKGLEFPVVIIPFLDWNLMPDPRGVIWAHSDEPVFNRLNRFPLAVKNDLIHSPFKNDYLAECKESFMDNLNLLYVAFTRSAQRLYATGNKKASARTISDLVYQTLVLQGKTPVVSGDAELFIFGTPAPFQSHYQVNLNGTDLYHPAQVAPFKSPVQNPFTVPALSIRFESDEVRYGNLVHGILGASKDMNDAHEAIRKLSRVHPEINTLELQATVANIFKLMDEQGWMNEDWHILAETDFSDGQGNILRPDRVFINREKAVVVDFKTGKHNPSHSRQVGAYAQMLQHTGISEVESWLIYTSDGILMRA